MTEPNRLSYYEDRPLIVTVTFNRIQFAKETIPYFLQETAGGYDHVIVDNGSTDGTKEWLREMWDKKWRYLDNPRVLFNDTNLGTAKAVNRGWALRDSVQPCGILHDDVTVMNPNWIRHCLSALRKFPQVGYIGLKWTGNPESPNHPNAMYKSTIIGTVGDGHEVETSQFPIGIASIASAELINKIGGMNQPGLYGMDDLLYIVRAQKAGFTPAFLGGMVPKHWDVGYLDYAGEYGRFKKAQVDSKWGEYAQWVSEYNAGTRDLFVPLA